MIDNMLKTTAMVLGKHRMPNDAVKIIWDQMRKAKRPLDEMLGLSDDNLYRVVVPMERDEQDIRSEFPLTYSVVVHLLHEALQAGTQLDLDTINLVKNEILLKGQAGKISKILSKQLSSKEDIITHCAKELGIEKPAQFLPKLGDIVKSGRKLVISSNMLDFITSSSNASFTSCHGFDGCHFNGNLAYVRDGITLITFVTNASVNVMDPELYKIGRCWVYVADKHVLLPKSYGGYFNFERMAALTHISSCMAEYQGISNDFNMTYGNKIPGECMIVEKPKDGTNGAAFYLDNYGIDIAAHKSSKVTVPKLNFAAAMCLVCGDTTANQKGGTCAEHNGKARGACVVCGTRHNLESLVTTGEGPACTACVRAHFVSCGYCGVYHRKETITKVAEGNGVCAPCLAAHYTDCSCCGNKVRKDRAKELAGVGIVCTSCTPKFMLCSTCKEYHKVGDCTYHKYVGRICKVCLAKVAFQCKGCGEFYLHKDAVGDTCTFCDARARGVDIPAATKPRYADLPEGWEDYTEEVG